MTGSPLSNSLPPKAHIKKLLAPYQHAELPRSLGMLANSLLPYLGLWVLMVLSLRIGVNLGLCSLNKLRLV